MNTTLTGWHTVFPDATAYIVPKTCRDVPFEDNMVFFLAEFRGQAAPVDPRGMLKRVIARAAGMDYAVEAAWEYKFFPFDKTPKRYFGII